MTHHPVVDYFSITAWFISYQIHHLMCWRTCLQSHMYLHRLACKESYKQAIGKNKKRIEWFLYSCMESYDIIIAVVIFLFLMLQEMKNKRVHFVLLPWWSWWKRLSLDSVLSLAWCNSIKEDKTQNPILILLTHTQTHNHRKWTVPFHYISHGLLTKWSPIYLKAYYAGYLEKDVSNFHLFKWDKLDILKFHIKAH